jgi:hypothetical protein
MIVDEELELGRYQRAWDGLDARYTPHSQWRIPGTLAGR